MAIYFAEIDESSRVVRVVSIPAVQVSRAQEYLSSDLGLGGNWIETFPDGSVRERFASVGMLYHADTDQFISAQPFSSWTLDASGVWQAPVACPGDTSEYSWNEDLQKWEAL
ncbi:hypothetical protein BMI91_19595 [Thioclava sediminum]|uniref:Uncharacterized protein n=1 Tax=Thioclava sediminum TaxID=1915319 RepID=A0ABX3MSF7_9RHOB|nr:hypothetical protein BMI91_19595 [Thioclava sediminum]